MREFSERMKELLGEEYPAYLASQDEPRLYGLRVNTTKISAEDFERIAPFPVRRIPYIPNGFFYDGESVQPAKHPYYFAGLYYLQDPSAMTPASRLPVSPGDWVLDLCAAPGGKSTELAAKLFLPDGFSGVLLANDISASRAKALQKNIELFGIPNSLITTEYPERLAGYFPARFDRILVDAPCSGEGMFRKDPAMRRAWTPDAPERYAALQEDIVKAALKMLKPGGYLMYSTCTFSPLEDEGTVRKILASDPSLSLVPMEGYEGFAPGIGDSMSDCVRIFPHRMEGEGHFLALFHKDGEPATEGVTGSSHPARLRKEESVLWNDFASSFTGGSKRGRSLFPEDCIESHDGMLYYESPELPDVRGLRFLRKGLYLGQCRKNRFEPSQALAMALRKEDFGCVLSLPVSDDRVIRYLKGETIRIDEMEESQCQALCRGAADDPERGMKDGFVLICVDGFPLGWGKKTGHTIKNKYHSGWRLM